MAFGMTQQLILTGGTAEPLHILAESCLEGEPHFIRVYLVLFDIF